MNTNKFKHKHQGVNSKRVIRQKKAQIRMEAYLQLSPAEQQEQKARNKAQYDAAHPRA